MSGGWNLNRRRFGERRAFQTEATGGKKTPGQEGSLVSLKCGICKGKIQEVTPDRETEAKLRQPSKPLRPGF